MTSWPSDMSSSLSSLTPRVSPSSAYRYFRLSWVEQILALTCMLMPTDSWLMLRPRLKSLERLNLMTDWEVVQLTEMLRSLALYRGQGQPLSSHRGWIQHSSPPQSWFSGQFRSHQLTSHGGDSQLRSMLNQSQRNL